MKNSFLYIFTIFLLSCNYDSELPDFEIIQKESPGLDSLYIPFSLYIIENCDENENQSLQISIRDESKDTILIIKSKSLKFIDSLFKEYYFIKKGEHQKYSIDILLFDNIKKISMIDFSKEINIKGSETQFFISLSFEYNFGPVFLSKYTVQRYYEGDEKIELRRKWIPADTLNPDYMIINESDKTIYGTGWGNSYFGFVFRRINNQWKRYERGNFCVTGVGGEQMLPNDSTWTIEGYFIGDPIAFESGKYKFTLFYSYEEILGLYLKDVEDRITTIREYDYYELYDEFEIVKN